MVVFATGACSTAGGAVMVSPPGDPEPGPGYVPPPEPTQPGEPVPGPGGYVPPVVPTQPGGQGDVWAIAVANFPSGTPRGVLWDAQFTYGRQVFSRGPAELSVVCPASPANMRVLGEPTHHRDQAGRSLRHIDPLGLELLVTVNGRVTDRYVVRGQVQHGSGKVRITGHTLDKLFDERVLGQAIPDNAIRNGSFEGFKWADNALSTAPALDGWHPHGGVNASIHRGGPAGTRYMRLTGPPGSYISMTTIMQHPWRRFGAQKVAASVLAKIPNGDWGDYGLVSVHAYIDGIPFDNKWEPSTRGLIDPSCERNVWLPDEIVAFGWLWPAPSRNVVEVRVYPVDEVQPVLIDEVKVTRRQATSTNAQTDLCFAVETLIVTEQRLPQKSQWNAGIIRGTQTGVKSWPVWWHGDMTSMPEAIESIVGRDDGPEVWPDGPTRRFHIAKRRGARRRDLKINHWDVLASAGWSQDSSEQASTIRGVSSASSAWGSAQEAVASTLTSGQVTETPTPGAVTSTLTGGQVIEVVMTAPAGMNPNELRTWLRSQLHRRRLPQSTTRLVLTWALGRRIAVGDQVPVAIIDGAAVLAGWHQVTAWECDPARRLVSIDVGTDPGGK